MMTSWIDANVKCVEITLTGNHRTHPADSMDRFITVYSAPLATVCS